MVNKLFLGFILVVSLQEVISQEKCSLNRKTRLAENYHPHVRFPRAIPGNEKNGNIVAYLDGGEHLLKLVESTGGNAVPNGKRTTHAVFPREQFTISVWTKPEGGQFENAVLLGKLKFF